MPHGHNRERLPEAITPLDRPALISMSTTPKTTKRASGSAFGRTETFITWASSKMATLLGQFKFFFESGELMSEVTHIENGRKAFTKTLPPRRLSKREGMYMTSRKLNEQGEPMR